MCNESPFFCYIYDLAPLYMFLLSFIIAAIITSNFYFMCQHYYQLNDDENDSSAMCTPVGAPECDSYSYSVEVNANEWQNVYPLECDFQSPINIRKNSINILERHHTLRWRRYDEVPCKIILRNNGSTLEVTCDCGPMKLPSITQIDQLNEEYFFQCIKFRWSMSNDDGSEHMVNDKKYPMEIQITHATKPKRNETKILMVSYFLTIVPLANIYLEPIVNCLAGLQKQNDMVVLVNDTFPLAWLLPQFETGYYSYYGSLTEPPYTGNIFWIIQPEPLAIGPEQMKCFRRMLVKKYFRSFHCSRPVQNLNMRNIFYNIPERCHDNVKLL